LGPRIGTVGTACRAAIGLTSFHDLWLDLKVDEARTHQARQWPVKGGLSHRAVAGSRLFFTANDGTYGNELWRYGP